MKFVWDWDYALEILPPLLKALVVTVEATVLGFLLALVVGLLLAVLRRAPLRLVRWPVGFFVEFVRSTPLLVQLYFLYFVLPDYGISLPALVVGVVGLGLHYSAYTAEVYRSGLDGVPRGQWEAARALNLSAFRTYRDVVVPQAIPPIIPALGNYLISMFKDSPLLSAITVVEALQQAKILGSESFQYLEPFTVVGLLFLALSLLSAAGVRRVEHHLPKHGIPMK